MSRMCLSWMVCISSVCLLLLGCSDDHGHDDYKHDAHGSHDFKIYPVGNHFRACPGGLHENGKPSPKEVTDRLREREVSIPDAAIKEISTGNGDVFYFIVALPDDELKSQNAVVGCSPDLREVAAWACEHDRTFDGALCELEFSEGGVPMSDHCVQTNMTVSGFVTRCVF